MKKPIHVLHLRKSEGFYGAERVILSLADQTNKMDYHNWIGCLDDKRYSVIDLVLEAKKLALKTAVFKVRSRFDVLCMVDIMAFVKKHKIDIIHCHGFKPDIYGWIVSRFTKTRIVSTQHGWTHSNRLIRAWEAVDIHFLRYFQATIGVSDEIATILKTKRIPANKIVVIPNGLAIDKGADSDPKIRKQLGIPDHHYVVGIIGRLSVEKDHDTFIDAAREIVGSISGIHFLIIGDGPLQKPLLMRVRTLGLSEKVHFLGYRKDVAEILACLDVVVFTSLREGLPIALLESMAARKTVVTTPVGSIPTLVQDTQTGFLFQQKNSSQLAKIVLHILPQKNMRKTIGDAARLRVLEQYSSIRMAQQYHAVYQHILHNHQTGSLS